LTNQKSINKKKKSNKVESISVGVESSSRITNQLLKQKVASGYKSVAKKKERESHQDFKIRRVWPW
jgi:hypothetical protein